MWLLWITVSAAEYSLSKLDNDLPARDGWLGESWEEEHKIYEYTRWPIPSRVYYGS